MLRSTLSRVASAAIVMAAFAAPMSAHAESMEFAAYDGSWQVTGELQSYEDSLFQIGTALGVLTVSAKLVMCQGLACPAPFEVWSDIQGSATQSEASNLVASPESDKS